MTLWIVNSLQLPFWLPKSLDCDSDTGTITELIIIQQTKCPLSLPLLFSDHTNDGVCLHVVSSVCGRPLYLFLNFHGELLVWKTVRRPAVIRCLVRSQVAMDTRKDVLLKIQHRNSVQNRRTNSPVSRFLQLTKNYSWNQQHIHKHSIKAGACLEGLLGVLGAFTSSNHPKMNDLPL